MIQNSSIEEVSVLTERQAADVELRSDAWLEREITPLTESLRYGNPESNWVLQTYQKNHKKSAQDNAPLRCLKTFNFGYAVRRIVIHSDGETIATVGSPTRNSSVETTNTIQVWNWQTGERLFTLAGHTAPITAIALSQDGKTLVSGSIDRTIRVWNFLTGQAIATLHGHNGPIRTIAVSPSGQTVISSGCDQGQIRDRAIRIWDVKCGEVKRIVSCLTDAPTLISANEECFLKIEKHVQILGIETGAILSTLKGSERFLALSGSLQTVAAVLGHQVLLRDVATGDVQSRVQLDKRDRAIQVATISPDGRHFVAAFARTVLHPKLNSYLPAQNILRVWNADTGESLDVLSQEQVGQGLWQFVEFSPNNRSLFTSVGHTVKVWQ